MTKREINTACKLLDSRTDRTEVIGLDTGGLALTAERSPSTGRIGGSCGTV